MDQMLQNRIQALLGPEMPMSFKEGGEVLEIDDSATMEEASIAMREPVTDQDESLREALDALMTASETAEDPFEARKAEQLAEGAVVGAQAPMGELALELAQAGRGGDTMLAHLTPGEVVLPLGMMDDADFERTVENRFNQMNLNPEEYVAGLGIASLNPITGLEEFGFFKKIAKGVKKVVKKVVRPVAKIAQYIPGPHQPLAIAIDRAGTVYDVAKGRASPLALASLGAPVPGASNLSRGIGSLRDVGNTLSNLGGTVTEFVTKGADGVGLLGNIGQGIRSLGGDLGSLVAGGGADNVGRFGKVGDILGTLGNISGVTNYEGLTVPGFGGGQITVGEGDTLSKIADAAGVSLEDLIAANPDIADPNLIFPGQVINLPGMGEQQTGSFFGQRTPDAIRGIEDTVKDIFNIGGGGASAGGGRSTLGTLGGLGVATLLGKLAYDEAKNRRGVPLTPLTQEGAVGRYNIEAEIARRMGKPAPNPVEFGLLPRGTMPTLSGGRATPERAVETETPQPIPGVETLRYGGPVMAFKDGGNVDMAEFKRMDGKIAGPGTEISDDIPAMLSDGEFVMTGRAVRGAGAFDMEKGDGGIVTLTPNGAESREKGTNLMYDMMSLFAEYADKPKEARSAA